MPALPFLLVAPDLTILGEILMVLALSIAVVYVCQRLRIPTIVGLLLTGALVGPGVFGLIAEEEDILGIAELGVVLLLFGIGLEFSVRDLLRMRGLVFGAGAAQLFLTTLAVALILLAFGVAMSTGLFLGALVALSSTALVLTLLGERGETGTRHGRAMLSILIFQDLMVVVLLLLVPILAGESGGPLELVVALGKAAAVVVGMLVVATRVLPWIFERVVRTRSRELFTITAIVAALGTAYLTGLAGLSLALGAFLAGIVVSESEYAPQIVSEIAPMRDGLSSLFFISLGMLFDPAVVAAHPWLALGLVVGVVLLKVLVTSGVLFVFGAGARVVVLASLGLAQIGEFSFVLAQEGLEAGLIGGEAHALFFVVSVVTLVLTPLALPVGERLAKRGGRWLDRFPATSHAALDAKGDDHIDLEDHVVLVGYGVNGRNVARVLDELGVKYVVLELNPTTVRVERDAHVPIRYGDATRRAVLEHMGVGRARAVVIAIADPAATRQITALARALNPQARILVRTRFVAEVEPLMRLGASEVVPEEFETSLELAGRVMAAYGATGAAVLREKNRLRRERYGALRAEQSGTSAELQTLEDLLGSMDVEIVPIEGEHHAAGRSIGDLELRRRTGASVLAVAGGGGLDTNPGAARVLRAGERVVLAGPAEAIGAARALLEAG